MKYLTVLMLSIFFLGRLESALPPFAESKREIEAILSHQEITQYIPSGDTIIQIVKTSSGYLIITNYRIVPVSIRHVARQNLGPARLTVQFHNSIETGANKPDEEGDHCGKGYGNKRSKTQSQ